MRKALVLAASAAVILPFGAAVADEHDILYMKRFLLTGQRKMPSIITFNLSYLQEMESVVLKTLQATGL